MKPLSSQEYKETIKALLTFVKSIAPQLQEVAKNREFELTITNDENGIGMSCSMGWDPLKDENKDAYYRAEEIREEGVNLEELEKESIKRALERSFWNRKVAAEALGFSTRTLNRKIKEYELKK